LTEPEEKKKEEDDVPDIKESYIQRIKNKIWLKMPTNKFTKVRKREGERKAIILN